MMPRPHSALSQWIHRPITAIPIALSASAGIYVLEARVNPDVSFEILYLFFVSLVAWSAPRIWAYGMIGFIAALLHVAAGYARTPPSADTLSLVWNVSTHLTMFLLAGAVIAQLRRDFDRALHVSTIDPLTGVVNRHAFLELLERETQRAHRYQRPHSVAFIDLDRFHEVNDRYGHRRGDAILTACAQAMQRTVRTTDTLGRIGGDEFALLLPETGDESRIVAEKLLAAVRSAVVDEGLEGIVGASIGVVTCPCVGPAESHRLLGHADDLMYEAKRSGGNAVMHKVLQPHEHAA